MLSSSCYTWVLLTSLHPIIMLSSSCGFDRHIGMLSSSCYTWVLLTSLHPIVMLHHLVGSTDTSTCYHHAIIILWVRQTHRHAIIMLSSSCYTWVLLTSLHPIIMLHHLVGSTDTSTCYHHAIIMLSSCYHHAIIMHARPLTRLAHTPFNTAGTHALF